MNRYHNKFHRHNHHTDVTIGDSDSSHDPIASASDPFKGDFHLNDNLKFTGTSPTIISDSGTVSMGCDLNISSFIIQNFDLNKIINVISTTPSDGDVLTYDAGTGKWVDEQPRLTSINDIDDVTITAPSLKQAIIWDGAEWVNGYPYAVYADLAENYTTSEKYRIGHIVSVSNGHYDVELCSRSTFDKLVGVVSENPGMLLDAELKNATPISYIGKVDILITGTCKKGDIIVLSKIDGIGKTANKLDKKYKIGYALEDKYCKRISPIKCLLKTI